MAVRTLVGTPDPDEPKRDREPRVILTQSTSTVNWTSNAFSSTQAMPSTNMNVIVRWMRLR